MAQLAVFPPRHHTIEQHQAVILPLSLCPKGNVVHRFGTRPLLYDMIPVDEKKLGYHLRAKSARSLVDGQTIDG